VEARIAAELHDCEAGIDGSIRDTSEKEGKSLKDWFKLVTDCYRVVNDEEEVSGGASSTYRLIFGATTSRSSCS